MVTCGNVPLESSFQKVPRCVYASTSLYEYRGWDSKAANPTHRRFTWGLRSLEVSNWNTDLIYLLDGHHVFNLDISLYTYVVSYFGNFDRLGYLCPF